MWALANSLPCWECPACIVILFTFIICSDQGDRPSRRHNPQAPEAEMWGHIVVGRWVCHQPILKALPNIIGVRGSARSYILGLFTIGNLHLENHNLLHQYLLAHRKENEQRMPLVIFFLFLSLFSLVMPLLQSCAVP